MGAPLRGVCIFCQNDRPMVDIIDVNNAMVCVECARETRQAIDAKEEKTRPAPRGGGPIQFDEPQIRPWATNPNPALSEARAKFRASMTPYEEDRAAQQMQLTLMMMVAGGKYMNDLYAWRIARDSLVEFAREMRAHYLEVEGKPK